ncbi:MAG: hypothetical protein ABI700_13230 [Chloroflexota bacterium]
MDAARETIFTSNERKALEALAQRRGFETVRAFMLALVKQDAEQHGEALTVQADEELDDPLESFKRGWDDAKNGRTMSREEFRRRMLEDAD